MDVELGQLVVVEIDVERGGVIFGGGGQNELVTGRDVDVLVAAVFGQAGLIQIGVVQRIFKGQIAADAVHGVRLSPREPCVGNGPPGRPPA